MGSSPTVWRSITVESCFQICRSREEPYRIAAAGVAPIIYDAPEDYHYSLLIGALNPTRNLYRFWDDAGMIVVNSLDQLPAPGL